MGEDEPKKKLDNKRKLFLKSKLLDYAKKHQEELKKNALEQKTEIIKERLPALPNLSGMDEEAIRQLCRELHCKRIYDDFIFDKSLGF